jgi:anti-anti-sigma factor
MHTDRAALARPLDGYADTLEIHCIGDTATWRLVVAGEVDAVTGTQLHRTLLDVLRHHRPRQVEIDLHDVAFLDSGGIRTLVSCHCDAEQLECELRITDVSPMVYRVLEITGLLDHLRVTAAQPLT